MSIRYSFSPRWQFNCKLLDWILISFIVIGIICITCKIKEWVYNACSSPVSYIIVTGERHYTTNTDINRIIVKLGVLGTFITQDVNIIQKKIEQLPWIQQVSVRKQWPDTLKVHIIEHIVLAYWNDSQIISTAGVIFNIPKEYQDHNNTKLIPFLYGPEGSEQSVLANYYVFNEILKSSKLQIKSVKIDARCSWEFFLQNNIHIKLGRDNIIERLYYFIKIYPILLKKINDNNKYIDYIDLRYRSGFAVRWISSSVTPVIFDK